MKQPVRYCLLLPALLIGQLATAQTTPAPRRPVPVPALAESVLQPVRTSVVPPAAEGVRFRYQLLKVEDNARAFLAPAWRGTVELKPERNDFLGNPRRGELDALVMETLNQLAQEGWELLEIQDTVRPVKATQKIETELEFNDLNRPTYKASTTIHTYTETRYLFRQPLGK